MVRQVDLINNNPPAPVHPFSGPENAIRRPFKKTFSGEEISMRVSGFAP
jgi:hypothetical protein